MKNKFLAMMTITLLSVIAGKAQEVAQGGTYKLEQSVIASGGGTSADSTGNVYKIQSTIGEAVAGTSSTGSPFSVRGGFLAADAVFAPTAATVSVSGQVLTPDGSGLVNARVTLTDSTGSSRTILTRMRGVFRFDDLNAGETYIITVNSRRYTFQPQVLSVLENLSGLVFNAQGSLVPLKFEP